jgi:ATP-binding cassette subfamily B protein/subfamily B ATP-binding cassette protein MsbA
MRALKHLWPYVARQRGFLLLVFALTFAASATTALQPWPMKWLVDYLEQRPIPEIFAGSMGRPGVLIAIIVSAGLLLFALNAVLEVISTLAWTLSGRRIVYSLSEDLFARLQRRSLLYHSAHPVGEVMSRVTTDCWAVYQLADTLLFAPLHALLTSTVMIFLMLPLDPTLTWITLVTAPLMVVGSFLLGKPLRAVSVQRRDVETRLQSHVQQILSGIPVVQAFVQEERERSRFQHFADEAIRLQQRSTLVGSLNSLSSGLITTLGTGLVLWFGAQHYLEGTLGIGSILAFLVYLNLLQAQMKVFANIYTTYQNFSARVDRVLESLTGEPEIKELPGARAPEKIRGDIRFENVCFGYEPGKPVLRDINLGMDAGEVVAFVGPSGAGKTTLVNLVPRFFDPWSGRVLIDGDDVRELQLGSLRAQIALVLQEPFLFPVSVAENIALGKPEATRKEIERAAETANAHDFICGLPEGYNTILGEYGTTLSGGERQRIAIARAILKNAPILILDEPTSALDAQTEKDILEALERLMRGRTTLLIAHRLSTVRHANQIVVLRDGVAAERGTHEELLARGRLYSHMHIQFDRK